MAKLQKKKVVVIGGGTGTFVVLSALKNYPLELVAIVSMADDGGSTGMLRDQYGVLPPGDARRALVALSESSETLRELFNHRFQKGSLAGHSFGNIFLSALEQLKGNFGAALEGGSRVLNVKGRVLPVTLSSVRLFAKLADGKVLKGETNIDIPRTKVRAKIKKVWLEPRAKLNPEARKAIMLADLVVIGPGDLYTSLIPNLLVREMPEAIKKSKAKKVFVCNLMTKFGETQGFCAEDFTQEIEKYLGKNILDCAVFNNRKPGPKILARYKKEKAEFVSPQVIENGILANLLAPGPFIRHDHQKLAKALISLL